MTYVNVLHPLFILGWLHAHERLCRPHGRTKVANSWRSPSLSGCAAIRHTRVYQRNYTTYGDIQMENLKGLRAILVENGFEQVELDEGATEDAAGPYYEKRGVAVVACSPFGPGSFPGPHTAGGRVLQRITASHHAGSRQTGIQFLLRRSGIFAVLLLLSSATLCESS
jgi:hypothetical protein